MIDNLKIVIFGNFMVIGKWEYGPISNPEAGIIHNPRTVHVIPQGNRLQIALNEIIGRPEQISVHQAQASYDVTDHDMMSLYIQATTGLTLAKGARNQ